MRSKISKKLFNHIYENYRDLSSKKGLETIEERLLGKSNIHSTGGFSLVHKNKINYSKDELCKIHDWDKSKPIACVFCQVFIEGNFLMNWRIFRDNLSWFRETLNYIKEIKHINWLIKPHPAEMTYRQAKTNTIIESLDYVNEYNHIKICPKDISVNSISKFISCAVTSHGTIAIEYAGLGIPSIMAAECEFENLFHDIPKNKIEYFNRLKIADNLNPITNLQMQKARILTFLQWNLTLTKNSLLPDVDPSAGVDVKKYWKDAKKLLENYDSNNDHFKKMLNYQFKNNLEHTIDLSFLK